MKTADLTVCCAALPHDLIVQVLLRLPARSLARLRCACRSWHAEISSRGFQERHHALAAAKFAFLPPARKHRVFAKVVAGRARPTQCLIYCRRCPRVVGLKPCCGVVLIKRPCTCYSVCNPTTGEILLLPQSHTHLVTGIGFHAPSGQFKVVQVNIELGKVYGRVLTVGEDRAWRAPTSGYQTSSFDDFTDNTVVHGQPVFADGCLHWSFKTDDEYIDKPHGILSFSLADESFQRVPQPPFSTADVVPYDHNTDTLYDHQRRRCIGKTSGSGEDVALPVGTALVELDGRLCMMRDIRYRSDVVGLFEIWKLQDYETGSWSQDYRIDMTPGHMAEWLTTPWLVVPLRYIGGGSPGEKRKLLLVTTAQEAHVYDPDAGTLRTVASIAGEGYDYEEPVSDDSLRLVLYQESLVRFDGMEQGKGVIDFVQLEHLHV